MRVRTENCAEGDVCAQGISIAEAVAARLAPLVSRPSSDVFGALPPRASVDDARVMQYAPHVRVVFSLLNEDAGVGNAVAGWDLSGALAAISSQAHTSLQDVPPPLRPLIRLMHALRSVHTFQLESQVQWYAPLAFDPRAVTAANESFYLASLDDVRVFINSPHWSLEAYGLTDKADATERTLHFVLFVPSAQHTPLYIGEPGTDVVRRPAWLVPQWGGVVVWNRAENSSLQHFTKPSAADSTSAPELSPSLSLDELSEPLSLFAQQLSTLLGFASNDDASMAYAVDGLLWRRTLEVSRETLETLASIVRLVHKIPNLGVDAQVRDEFEAALKSLGELQYSLQGSSLPSLSTALAMATRAESHASRSFFDPSMLAMLYFPDEHKYAVYTPLFGPLFVPRFVTLAREVRAARARKAARVGKE